MTKIKLMYWTASEKEMTIKAGSEVLPLYVGNIVTLNKEACDSTIVKDASVEVIRG